MSGSVKAWLQYGVTINVLGDLQISDCEGVNRPVFLQYAARLNVGGELKINGSCPTAGEPLLFATAAGGDANTPIVTAKKVTLRASNGGGAVLNSCHFDTRTLDLACPAYGLVAGDNVSTAVNKARFKVDRLVATNTGTTYVMFVDTPVLAAPYVFIEDIAVYDTRGTKASAVVQVGSGNSLNLHIGSVSESSGVPLYNWVGADKHVRVAQRQFVCQGTPEGMIPAPIGSIACRIDGGVNTSFYVKQSGTGNTGWAAK
jgi:hypothetical protein